MSQSKVIKIFGFEKDLHASHPPDGWRDGWRDARLHHENYKNQLYRVNVNRLV